tara:strand:- start:374 stop:571 length:198 start_codon:yes stop_codon:yes gene_type:complete
MSTYTINGTKVIEGYSLVAALENDGFTRITAKHDSPRKLNGKYRVTATKDSIYRRFTIVWNEKKF